MIEQFLSRPRLKEDAYIPKAHYYHLYEIVRYDHTVRQGLSRFRIELRNYSSGEAKHFTFITTHRGTNRGIASPFLGLTVTQTLRKLAGIGKSDSLKGSFIRAASHENRLISFRGFHQEELTIPVQDFSTYC